MTARGEVPRVLPNAPGTRGARLRPALPSGFERPLLPFVVFFFAKILPPEASDGSPVRIGT